MHNYLSHLMTKPAKWHIRPAKTQISLGICLVWSESSLCTQWVAKDQSFLHADSEDYDQTGWMPRLIWVFAGCTCHFVGFVMRWLIFKMKFRTLKVDVSYITIMIVSFGQTSLDKQCRPRSVWSGSTLFAIPSASFGLITLYLNKSVSILE